MSVLLMKVFQLFIYISLNDPHIITIVPYLLIRSQMSSFNPYLSQVQEKIKNIYIID